MSHKFLPHPELDMLKPHEIRYISESRKSKQINNFKIQVERWMQEGRVTLIARNKSYTGLVDPHGTKKGKKMWMWRPQGKNWFG